jgi:predicted permease
MDAGSWFRDFTYGLRLLRKNLGFTALAVLTLALGIGATTAVFSLVNAVLLRALPYHDPGRLVFLFEPVPKLADVPLEGWGIFNGDFYDWKKQSRSFDGLALFTTDRINLSVGPSAVRVIGSRVTGGFFPLLGIAPELGRVVTADDDRPGKGQIAVISHALWESRFGSDRGVLGKELQLDAKPYRIVGVMPAGFAFPHGTESIETHGKATDIWIPWAMTPQEAAARDDDPGNGIARLRPGVSAQRAQAELNVITASLDKLHPQFFQGCEAVVRPFDVEITGTSRRTLLILMGAVFLVLLIACSNVASLVLARAQGRALEVGVRTALGASRWRMVRQLLAESLCLGGAGGILGVVAASFAVRLLIHLSPGNVPRIEETSMDGRVLLFAVCISMVTAVLFGLFPALSTSQCNLQEVLKSSANRSVKKSAGRLLRGLTVAQVALTFVLLTGSGLLIRSLLKVQSLDKGFTANSTLTMGIRLDDRYRRAEQMNAFFRNVIERAEALPGVEAAAVINQLPLGGGESLSTLEVEGHPQDSKTLFESRDITPRYFTAMGIPIIAGRAFTAADRAGSSRVAIVSRSFANKYFPGQDAVGKRLRANDNWRTIVGVAADVRQYNLEAKPPMQVYGPLWQSGTPSASVVVRTKLPPDRLGPAIQTLVREIDPAVAVADVGTMSQLLSRATAARRFQTLLLTVFAGVAFFLSLVGLYGLMACLVEQRTAEMGIRMALGAQPGSVLRLIMRQGSKLAFAGIALGFACSWLSTRALASLLFEVAPTDAPTFLAVSFAFATVALAACYIPARRATRVDPMVALRCE